MAANEGDLATLDDPASGQPPTTDTSTPGRYHQHIPITDPVTGQPTGDNVTDQGQYGSPIVSASPPVYTRPIQSQQPPPEPFISSRNDRPHHQWGTDDFALAGARNYPGMAPGPLMPQMRDFAGLIHNAVMGLGRFGSHYTGMPAIAMGTYASAYWKAYQSGMKERAAQNYQQYRMARQMTIDRGKEETLEYAKIFAAHYVDGKIDDPDAFSHELLAAASKYQNHSIINAIESGNLGAAERIIGATDSHISNLIKAQHQEERQRQAEQERQERLKIERGRYELEQKREAEREKANAEKRKALEDARKAIDPNATGPGPGYKPDAGPDSGPGSIIPPEPTPPPESGDDAETPSGDRDIPSEDDTAPADSGPEGTDTSAPQDDIAARTRGMVADASGQATPGSPAEPSKSVGFGPEGKAETPVLENAAKGWVINHKIPDYIDKKTMPDFAVRTAKRGQDLENYLNKLASDPKVTSDQMKNELRRLFPGFAANVEKAISGDLQPPRTIGPSNQQFWNLLSTVGNKIDPNFTSDTFAARAKARLFWTAGPGGTKMTTIGTAFHHLNELRDLVLQGKKPMQLTGGFSEWYATHFGDYSEFPTTLNRAMHEMENALASSGTGGGSATIPAMKAAIADMTINQRDSNFLKKVDDNIKLLTERLGELYSQYQTTTGRKSDEVAQRFQEYAKKAAPAYKDLDPTFSDNLLNAPDRLKALMEYKSGATAGKTAHTQEEISGAKKWLADPKNANDPRRSKIEQILGGQ